MENYLTLSNENRDIILRATAETWQLRCKTLNLKLGTKGRQRELEAFLQGALAVLIATRVINLDTVNVCHLFVCTGRGESVIEMWAKE